MILHWYLESYFHPVRSQLCPCRSVLDLSICLGSLAFRLFPVYSCEMVPDFTHFPLYMVAEPTYDCFYTLRAYVPENKKIKNNKQTTPKATEKVIGSCKSHHLGAFWADTKDHS